MAHYHSGLPPMDLEPFDPTPLWAATHGAPRVKHIDGTSLRSRALRLVALVGVLAAVAVAGVVLFA